MAKDNQNAEAKEAEKPKRTKPAKIQLREAQSYTDPRYGEIKKGKVIESFDEDQIEYFKANGHFDVREFF